MLCCLIILILVLCIGIQRLAIVVQLPLAYVYCLWEMRPVVLLLPVIATAWQCVSQVRGPLSFPALVDVLPLPERAIQATLVTLLWFVLARICCFPAFLARPRGKLSSGMQALVGPAGGGGLLLVGGCLGLETHRFIADVTSFLNGVRPLSACLGLGPGRLW